MEQAFGKRAFGGGQERIPLFAGIELSYTDHSSFPVRHEAHSMQINYCRGGQLVWSMHNDRRVFFNPGDFSVHTPGICMDSTFQFPTGQYQGLAISIDLQEVSAHPPRLIAETGIFRGLLQNKFCREGAVIFLTGNETAERIFSAFYGQPENLRLSYQRIKTLELLLYLARMEDVPQNRLAEYPSEQVKIVREIHDRLLRHMEQRITIEELSRQYLLNPTTLKAVFKAVYGTSLAAHMKGHRIEQAAKMLRETDMSIAEIAQAVGYDSQSKFTSAFKKQFAIPPTAYRKQN